MKFSERIARLIAPSAFQQVDILTGAVKRRQATLDNEVNDRVANILFKMDPFEPLMRKYHVIFSEEWERPEEKLDTPSQQRMFMWAYGMQNDPSFKFLTDWVRNTQGNATLSKAKHPDEWFYGRAALATITLFVREIGRLSSHYEVMMRAKEPVNKDLTVE